MAPLNITGTTQLAGIIGWPLSHTFSPAMHNAAARELGIDLLYLPLPVHPDQLRAAVKGLPALGFLGINVTVPHKETVMPLLDKVDPAAEAIGAVNTIVMKDRSSGATSRPDSQLHGFNTDWSGFRDDLKALGVETAGRDCLVLGGGGSARAVIYALASSRARVTISARREEQARKLASDLKAHIPGAHISILQRDGLRAGGPLLTPALIVNTTPVGMNPEIEATPWPEGTPLPAGAFVYDLVYNPRETKLIRQAKTAGLGAASGIGMLTRQGAEAFHLWTGQAPDLSIMAGALNE